jgi:hypothetical protein
MKILQQKLEILYLSVPTLVLLRELGEECQYILKLLAQLEVAGLSEAQKEDILGDLSAAVLHMHEHTRGLDALIDED